MFQVQKAFIKSGRTLIHLDIPPADEEVLPNTKWGDVAGFPTVAYWLFKVLEQRLTSTRIKYKLGNSLLEEVGACLLGGHGIPAANGIAAFEHMKSKNVFDGTIYSEEQLFSWLSEPIKLTDRTFKYRFAKQKSKYLHCAIKKIAKNSAPQKSGKSLRNWLTEINGIGLKTASWVARNWLDADDVAILDIHIYRAGILGGFFNEKMNVEKHYLALEEQFISLAKSMEVSTAELDAIIWFEMQDSSSVHKLLSLRENGSVNLDRSSTNKHRTNPYQTALI